MESPPSNRSICTWSEAYILSDDSGLLLTSGSISSGSMSEGRSEQPFEEFCDNKSLSQSDSLDGMSDIMCGEHFNTLKKGPHWSETKTSPIEPPFQFQDRPKVYDIYASRLAVSIVQEVINAAFERNIRQLKLNALSLQVFRPIHQVIARTYWTPDFLPFSPCHGGRPSSRSSLCSSRLSSSHNSLSVPTAHRADDSSFITQAVSHDTLISDLYNVPFDCEVYAVPVDTLKPLAANRIPKHRINMQHKKRRRNTSSGFRELLVDKDKPPIKVNVKKTKSKLGVENSKRHSVAGTSTNTDNEPIHMTLLEVRQYLQTLYSSSSDSSEHHRDAKNRHSLIFNNNKYTESNIKTNDMQRKKTFHLNLKNKRVKDCDISKQQINAVSPNKPEKQKKGTAKIFSLKQTLCNMFRFRRILSPDHPGGKNRKHETDEDNYSVNTENGEVYKNISNRALPPLPASFGGGIAEEGEEESMTHALDFATSIRKVKDYGWYWGPLSSEAAEKILSNEPDGSFIVRDSSDDHYIFSLTFKLNNTVRHVRIEHDQGNFSFGSCTKFKSQTIVEFIENAVEHSRSGRYLFFLHRRPTIGPVRVQLLHPVSRFKQIQSLQHMCRFVILKKVRKDLITSLPLPRRMIDYLSTPHYYSEHLIDDLDDDLGINHFDDTSEESELLLNHQT